MFDIAWSELLLIVVVALIFIGPKELPAVLHTLGRMVAKLRRSADDFRRQFEDSVREAGYEDLHKNIQEFRSLHPANQLKDSIARAITDYAPKPAVPDVPAPQPQAENKAQPSLEAPAEKGNGAAFEMPAAEPASQEARLSGSPAPAAPAELAKDRVAPAA
jgi:sec-independent protein translocase protein TatB